MPPPLQLPPRRRSGRPAHGSPPRSHTPPALRRAALIVGWLVGVLATVFVAASAGAQAAGPDFETFTGDDSPRIRALIEIEDREYRQIEPTLWHLAVTHDAALAALGPAGRSEALADLADFVLTLRDRHTDAPVLAEGRRVIGLLDPDRGLDPKEITTIAGAYGAEATVWKQGWGGPTGPDTKPATAAGFLAAVRAAAADVRPTTIVVLGHGLPTEIQSYAIPCDTLAAAFLDGLADAPGPRTSVDLRRIVLVCDDCFSADFLENLGRSFEEQCRARSLDLVSLPTCIAGTNRDRYGIADVGEKFVPHFWKDVIELFWIRRPLPEAVVLGDFFGPVDAMMEGYGRAPIIDGGRVTGYRLVNPDLVQDPVVFVSLDDEDLATLRRLLGLPADAPLHRLFDIG